MRENGKNLAIKMIFFICMGFVLKAAAYGLYAKPHGIACGLEAGGGVSLREMSVWLLTVSPALLCAGNRLEQRIRLANTDMIRYGSYRKWWLTLAGQNTAEMAAYAVCLLYIGGWPGGKRLQPAGCDRGASGRIAAAQKVSISKKDNRIFRQVGWKMDKISLHNISKSFKGEQVIRTCSLTFEEGRIYGIIGRNGTGKTVLLKMICGLYLPDTGSVEIFGKEVGKGRDFAENVGILIETPGFLGGYTGFQNLKYLAQIQNKIGDDEIRQAMETVGLDWKSKKRVGKYSLGMKQRLGIAQVIMEEPRVLLLDEPMNGLDQGGVETIRALLLELRKQGKIIILASHIKEDIELICDTVYKIEDGSLIMQ